MFLFRFPHNSKFQPFRLRMTCRTYASTPPEDQERIAKLRQWLASFTPESIPRKNCKVTFSRASGPGGQNVNKINSKATLRLDLSSKAGFIPQYVLDEVRRNSRYMTKSNEIVIQADTSRSQPENTEECFRKLYESIKESVKVPGETSEETKKRVAKLERDGRERRLKEKKTHGLKKSFRRGGRDDY